jgi:hypothetical protein
MSGNPGAKATVLVYAWDPYRAAWPPFRHGLNKYWPDCPFPVVFLTNHAEAPCGTTVRVGDVNDCYTKLRMGLDRIDTPYVVFMHDDFWIKAPVKTAAILDYIALMDGGLADYVRLNPSPGPDSPFARDSRLGIIDVKNKYRLSFMASIWRHSLLRGLLRPDYSLWQMEKHGAELTRRYGDLFLSVWNVGDGIDYVATAITERYWIPAAFQYARDERIQVAFDELSLPPFGYRLGVRLRRCGSRVKAGLRRVPALLSPWRSS